MSHKPLDFIDTIGTGRHAVLFYEEPEYARMIEFRFITDGLLKGEDCVYVTREDTKHIENEMADAGIDVAGFKRKNLLHIYNIPNPMEDPEGVPKSAWKIWDRITKDSKRPFRVVVLMVPEINTEKGILAELDVEQSFHRDFDKLGCSIMCPYFVKKIASIRRGEWIARLLQYHHDVIFASQFWKGIALKLH